VQVLPPHDPLGAIEKIVSAVTLPIEPPSVSNACAVYEREPPGWIVAFEGEMTMWSKTAAADPTRMTLLVASRLPFGSNTVSVTVYRPGSSYV